MTTTKFSALAGTVRADTTRRHRVDEYKQELLAALTLSDLRAGRGVTQVDLARRLKTTQPGVSRLEHQTDLYLSTLRQYVEALGGRLEIHGVFADGRVPIAPFGAEAEPAAKSPAASGVD